MTPGASLYLSGFYTDDVPLIREAGERCGFTFLGCKEKNRWAMVKMRKDRA